MTLPNQRKVIQETECWCADKALRNWALLTEIRHSRPTGSLAHSSFYQLPPPPPPPPPPAEPPPDDALAEAVTLAEKADTSWTKAVAANAVP